MAARADVDRHHTIVAHLLPDGAPVPDWRPTPDQKAILPRAIGGAA